MTQNIKLKMDILPKLFGNFDENAILIEKELKVVIKADSEGLVVSGDDEQVALATQLIGKFIELISKGFPLDKAKVRQSIDLVKDDKLGEITNLSTETVAITAKGKRIYCKTLGQKGYVGAIKKNTIVFGIGPAGSGKTYLAVALAVALYKSGDVEKIILTRPALEAGEKLGFLPGDLQMKVDPYLRPLYDALEEMFGIDSYQKLIERGIIEIAPLAYMRGRTLGGSFIILDEAQNATDEQLKMFLTRLGEGSKMVITGDNTQIDLPYGRSGLMAAARLLADIEGIKVCMLSDKDVVRSELVQKIVKAYAGRQSEQTKDERM